MTQRGKAHTRKAQPKHAYMYTRHNHNWHVIQHNAHKHVTQIYQNAHCHCNCMSHSMTQKSYRKHPLAQNTRHVSYTRKAYHPRVNKFANVECFYCMTKGHIPFDYLETNQPRPRKVWV